MDKSVPQGEQQIRIEKKPVEINTTEQQVEQVQGWQLRDAEMLDKLDVKHRTEMLDAQLAREALLDDKKTFGDSKLMKAVKGDVDKVGELLSKVVTAEEMEEVEQAFFTAILSCNKYLGERSSSSKTGSRRRELVEANRDRLISEYELVSDLRTLMTTGRFAELLDKGLSLQDLLYQVRIYHLGGPRQEKMGNLQSGNSVTTDPELNTILRAFKTDTTPMKDKKKEAEYAASIGKLRRILSEFPEAQVHSAFFTYQGISVLIKQDEHGTMTISGKNASVVMKEGAHKLLDMLSMKMIEEQDRMSSEDMMEMVSDLRVDKEFEIDPYFLPISWSDYGFDEDHDTTKKDVRQILTARSGLSRYLEIKTGMTAATFANMEITNLRWLCYGYIQGTDEKLMSKTLKDLIEVSQREDNLINNMETLELLKETKRQKEEVEEKVIIHQQQEQEQEDGWDEEERQVRDLMADLVFSSDTWEADESAMHPGERVRRMLLKNIDGLALIIEQSYQGEKNEEKSEEFETKIENILLGLGKTAARDAISGQLSEEKLEKKLEADLTKELDQDLIQSEMKMLVLDMVEDLKKEGYKGATRAQIKEDLQKILKEADDDTMEACTRIDERVDMSVETCSVALQEKINKSVKTVFDGGSNETEEEAIPEEFEVEKLDLGTKEKVILRIPKADIYYDDGRLKSPMEKGISKEVREKRSELCIKELNKILEDSMKGESGQGRFIKEVFNNYFSGANLMDRRNMFAYALRSSKKSTGDQKADAGRFLGGIMKGAGPLFQKMMQGLPSAGMPEEIQSALEDMKSKLAPIPEQVVKAQLLGIVKRSDGKVDKIEVTRALGAASVGQTFLCKMYGPKLPKEGKDVVVKLLKPDVRNRMMREKEIMLKCADNTDSTGGMKATYLGQLSRIEEELDLTIEARNVVKGEIYDGDEGISSMKLDSTVGASVNSMVLEKAPGTTLDRYVKDLRDKNATRFAELEEQNKGIKAAEAVAKVREELVADLAQLIKRQKFMATLSDKWVTEGIFGKGFYHGDLHAGNIMINDDGVTLIDFGNATSLSEDQQLNVTRMVGAAAAGHVAGFMEGLKSLIKPEFKELFDENGKNLSAELKKIFSLGDPNAAGQRIAVALLKVQEAGVEVPSAIFNFSQCQLRLQNAVEDMNTLIEEMKHQLIDMERLTKKEAGHTTANPIEDGFCHIAAVIGTKETTADNGILMEDLALSARYVPCAFERVDLNRKTLMSGEFYKTVFKGRDDRKKMEAAVKKLCKRLLEAKGRFSETDFKAIIKENSAISGITNLDYLLVDTRFSGADKEKRIKELETHLMGKMDRWFQTIEVYKSKEKAIKKGDEDAMREFLESYSIFGMLKIEEGFVAAHYDLSSCVFRTFRNYLNAGFTLGLDEDIATYERLDEELGPQMRKKYDEYMEYIKDAGATVDGLYTRQEEIMLILSRLTEKRLRPFYENMETVYWDSVHSKPQSFVDVMGMTISRNYEKAMSRLGFFTGIYYNSKIR